MSTTDPKDSIAAISVLFTVLVDELIASESINKERLVATIRDIGDVNNKESIATDETKRMLCGYADIVEKLRSNEEIQ